MRYILAILATVLLFNSQSYAQGLTMDAEQDGNPVAVTSQEVTAPQSLEEKLAAKKAAVHAKMLAKKAELGVKDADDGNTPEAMILESEVIVEEQPNNINNVAENNPESPAVSENGAVAVEDIVETVSEAPAIPENTENVINEVIPENQPAVIESITEAVAEVPNTEYNQAVQAQVEQVVDENAHNNENALDDLDELLAQ